MEQGYSFQRFMTTTTLFGGELWSKDFNILFTSPSDIFVHEFIITITDSNLTKKGGRGRATTELGSHLEES